MMCHLIRALLLIAFILALPVEAQKKNKWTLTSD